jgi:hypothetical protein
LLGWSYLDPNNTIQRILPAEHDDIDNFFAEDATIEGMGVLGHTGNSVTWTVAKVNVNYKPRDYNVKNTYATELDRFITRTFSVNADYLSLNGQVKFCSNQLMLNNAPGRITATMELTYTWHQVPAKNSNPFEVPNLNSIAACLGQVNSTTFDANNGSGGYPPGTILFLGIDPKMLTGKRHGDTATNPNGNYFWEIQHKFLYRNNGLVTITQGATSSSSFVGPPPSITEYAGHNFIFNIAPSVYKWDLVTANGSVFGPRIYQTTDLNSIFTIS